MTSNFRYSRADAPVREQLAALHFLRALATASEVLLTDQGGSGRPELRLPPSVDSLPPELDLVITFLENVRTIEEWADVEFTLPENTTATDAQGVAIVAGIIRSGGSSAAWDDFEVVMPADRVEALRGGHVVRCENVMGANVLGRTVELGYGQVDVVDFHIASEEPAPGWPGEVVVRIEPNSAEAANVFQRLVKLPTEARQ